MEHVGSEGLAVGVVGRGGSHAHVHGHAHAQGNRADHVPHVLPLRSYVGVWLALLVLTVVTVAVSYFNFGDWNIVVALLVASVKATLVAGIFMHLAFEKRKFNAIVILVSALFLVVLIAFTMFDTEARGIADPVEAERAADHTQPFNQGKPAFKGAPEPAQIDPASIPIP